MTGLDTAGLVIIAARTLGLSTEAALAVMDIPAAQAALAETRLPGSGPGAALPGRDAAAAAGVSLVHALLRHRPFPRQGQQVAVAAGLQFLALNGWQADLDPPATTAVVIGALASGQLTAGDAAAWLAQRLSPAPRAHRALRGTHAVAVARRAGWPEAAAPASRAARPGPGHRPGRRHGRRHRGPRHGLLPRSSHVIRRDGQAGSHGQRVPAGQASQFRLAYTACMRVHGIRQFPEPSPGGLVAIAPGTGIDPASALFRSAALACTTLAPAAGIRIVTAG